MALTIFFRPSSQLLADYLKYLFPLNDETGAHKVSMVRPVGKLLTVLACPAEQKPAQEDMLLLELPQYHNATASLKNKWLIYTKSDTERINIALKAEFDLDFECYYRAGEALGFQKKNIIDAFIFSRKLTTELEDDTLEKTHATLHKRVYRDQVYNMEQIRKRLLRKAYYINSKIDLTGLDHDTHR